MRTAVCVIQARTGSTRLPGKVLADVSGRPMLGLMLERLGPLRARSDIAVVVATSDTDADDDVAAVGAEVGVPVVRGSEHDVLGRVRLALDRHPADDLVRLTADCPLMDPALVEAVLVTHRAERSDYTSNTLLRTFPDGLDVEVVTAEALIEADGIAADSADREHVTPVLYRHPSRFRLVQHTGNADAGDERWTIDTDADLEWLRSAVAGLDDAVTAPWPSVLDRQGRRGGRRSVRLVPASSRHAGDTFERVWTVRHDDAEAGTAAVRAGDGGRAEVEWALETIAPSTVRPALERTLATDRQVDTVHEADGEKWEIRR